MKTVLKSKTIQIAFALIGVLGGFLYWKFVGCESGTCAIKSVWYWSTLWGAVVGYLVGDFISDFINKRKKSKNENNEHEV
jgi:hypothetical protein